MINVAPVETRVRIRMPTTCLALGLVVAAGCGPTRDPWPKTAPDRPIREEVATKDYTSAVSSVPDGPTVTDLGGPCEDVFAGKLINLDAENQEVDSLLSAVATHGGIQLVFDDTNSAKVTVKLHEVPLRKAIEALAKAGGLRAELRGCTLHIVSDGPY